jgi:hypothetical protein
MGRGLQRLPPGQAIDQDRGEDAAEQHDLGGEEHPHAELRRLTLLRLALERQGDMGPDAHEQRSGGG